MTIKEMLEKRAKLVKDARAIYEKAEGEKRDPNAEERKQFDDIMDAAQALKKEVEDKETDLEGRSRLEAAEKELEASRGRQSAMETPGTEMAPETRMVELRPSVLGDTRNVILSGPTATEEYMQGFRNYLCGEKRALQKDSDTAGGYLSAPVQFIAELIRKVDNLTFMRQICRVLPPLTSAESIGAPSLDNDPADPIWTAEIGTGDEDSTMSFGGRELTPAPVAKRIKVSKTLIRRSSIGVDAIVRDRLSYKMAVVMENAYINGTGANGQPLGVMTATSLGISTGRDVSTGNTSTTPTFDGLKEAKYTLKGQYRPRANWLFHRTIVKLISKLKDGEGRYIWEASVVIGDPDRILGMPVRESEYMPNTISSSEYVGILGDFSRYWIADSLASTIQVLLELYAEANQNGYILRMESDGMPVLAEAFIRVKLGS